MTKCNATTKKGAACTVPVKKGEEVCVFHTKDADENRSLGGKQSALVERAYKSMPAGFRGITDGLRGSFFDVLEGNLDPRQAHAAAAVATALIKTAEFALMEQRINSIETLLIELAEREGIHESR
tara:strand:- start:743 stop:1117 length:375 start_codon:yes stop_codon:yes gene_type:complete